jgi:hypothetical protein
MQIKTLVSINQMLYRTNDLLMLVFLGVNVTMGRTKVWLHSYVGSVFLLIMLLLIVISSLQQVISNTHVLLHDSIRSLHVQLNQALQVHADSLVPPVGQVLLSEDRQGLLVGQWLVPLARGGFQVPAS